MDRGKVINFNTAINMGVYYILDDPISVIGNPGIKYGVLVVFPSNTGPETYSTQIAFEMFGPNRAFHRTESAKNEFSGDWTQLH